MKSYAAVIRDGAKVNGREITGPLLFEAETSGGWMKLGAHDLEEARERMSFVSGVFGLTLIGNVIQATNRDE